MKSRERIYIIPTRYGVLYVVGIFVTLAAGAIYANNLVYLLSFFLVALTLIGMVQTHSNLKGLQVQKIELALSPEDSTGKAKIWLASENGDGHNQLQIQSYRKKDKFNFLLPQVLGKSLAVERFTFIAGQRGKKQLEAIQIASTFPFGLFYAWRIYKLKAEHFVFPKSEGSHLLPEASVRGDSIDKKMGQNGDDYTQHRKYQVGESHKHIDWKAYARGRPLLVKEFKEGDRNTFILDMEQVAGSTEIKLRQIVKWIESCEQRQLAYGLKLGALQIPPQVGSHHRERCLKILAEYPSHEVA